MLILTSVTACWHESINITRDNLHPRSYADDLSATVAQRTESAPKPNLKIPSAKFTPIHKISHKSLA